MSATIKPYKPPDNDPRGYYVYSYYDDAILNQLCKRLNIYHPGYNFKVKHRNIVNGTVIYAIYSAVPLPDFTLLTAAAYCLGYLARDLDSTIKGDTE